MIIPILFDRNVMIMTYFDRMNGVNWYYVLLNKHMQMFGANYSTYKELYYEFDNYKVLISKIKEAFIISGKDFLSAFSLDNGWMFTRLPTISKVRIK